MRANEPQDALPDDGEAPMNQAGPHLPIALAVDRWRRKHQADRLDDRRGDERRLRPALRRDDGRDGLRRQGPARGTRNMAQIIVNGSRRPVPRLTARLSAAASSPRPRVPFFR